MFASGVHLDLFSEKLSAREKKSAALNAAQKSGAHSCSDFVVEREFLKGP